jgi:hypothetical protein
MIRARIRVAAVAAVVAACSSFAIAPAQASTCHPDPLGPDVSGEEKICQTVYSLTCQAGQKLGGGCPFE